MGRRPKEDKFSDELRLRQRSDPMAPWRSLCAAALNLAVQDKALHFLASKWGGVFCDIAGVPQRCVVEAAEKCLEPPERKAEPETPAERFLRSGYKVKWID